jgi:hypothetical protein
MLTFLGLSSKSLSGAGSFWLSSDYDKLLELSDWADLSDC